MRTRATCLLGLISLTVRITAGAAQTYAPPAGLLDSLASLVRERYVFPVKGEAAAARLRSLAPGTDSFTASSAAELASRLTRLVRGWIDDDRHFALIPPATGGEGGISRTRGTPSGAGILPREERAAGERRLGHYFRSIERLPGNVLVVDFEQFPLMTEQARLTASAAMQLAATADAVILDLRLNRGGAEGMNQYIASHFFADTALVLYARYQREGDRAVETRVLPTLAAPRMPEVPLFIVVDGGTASAAENLSYTLQQHRRAVVIGDTTAGGANSATMLPLPGGWLVQMPVARVLHPRTGTNWEGRGVVPDLWAPDYVALDSAYALALRTLASRAAGEAQRREVASAQSRLMTFAPPDTLAVDRREFVGRYGSSEVRIEGGELVIQSFGPNGEAGATLRLLPRGGDRFIIEGLPFLGSRLTRFTRDAAGRVIGRSSFSDAAGEWVVTPRSP